MDDFSSTFWSIFPPRVLRTIFSYANWNVSSPLDHLIICIENQSKPALVEIPRLRVPPFFELSDDLCGLSRREALILWRGKIFAQVVEKRYKFSDCNCFRFLTIEPVSRRSGTIFRISIFLSVKCTFKKIFPRSRERTTRRF